MKILYISPRPIPSDAANAVHMMKMAQAMGQAHDVTLACFAPADKDVLKNKAEICAYYHVENNFKLKQFPQLQGRLFSRFSQLAFALRNGLRAGAYDLVFSRCLLSACCAAFFGGRVVFEIHDSPRSYNPFLLCAFQWLKVQKNLCALVVISEALKRHLVDEFSMPSVKIIVAHDGADPIAMAGASCPFDKKGFDFHAGYTGHLYEGRGIDIIAGAAAALPEMGFHIVGGKSQDVAFWKTRFPNLQNLIFYGHVPHGVVADFLCHFDVLLAPYQRKVAVAGNTGDTSSWMSPLKIFEYMSAGKLIICSDLPVLAEVLEHKRNAYLCPPEDVSAWVEALKTLKTQPDLAQKIGRAARDDFEKAYTWQKRAEHILQSVRVLHAV